MTNTDLNEKTEGKKVYEVGYLLLPNIEEGKISEESEKIRDIIEKNNSTFLSDGTPEMMTLSYQMVKEIEGKNQKFDNAYFGWVKFESDSDSIKEIKLKLDTFDNILRFMIVTTVKEDSFAPSSNLKTGKFSFDEEKSETPVKEEEKIEKKEKPVEKKTEESEKELDETIDDLVIE